MTDKHGQNAKDRVHLLNNSEHERDAASSRVHSGSNPDKDYGAGDETCFQRAKRNKTLVLAVVGTTVLALIILIAVASKSSPKPGPPGPQPGPPGPVPPVPPTGFWNPYEMGDLFTDEEHRVYGVANLQKNQENYYKEGQTGDGDAIEANARQIPTGANNKLAETIRFEIGQTDYKTARVTIAPVQSNRYSPPEDVVQKPGLATNMKIEVAGLRLLHKPFGFSFSNPNHKDEVLIHTNGSTLVVMDKYIQLDLQLPSQRIFGLGERTHSVSLGEGTWTMWANGDQPSADEGMGGKSSYGVHPFVLVQSARKDQYFGMYFRNSNAQSPVVTNKADGNSTLSYITTGGQIEMYVMLRGTAKEVIQQYQRIVGLPRLPPLWSLGWHISSKTYKTQADMEAAIKGYSDAGIPLEGVWLDQPYMGTQGDFSVDVTAFASLKDFVTITMKPKYQKLVLRINEGLFSDDKTSKYYKQAADGNALIESAINKDKEAGKLTQQVTINGKQHKTVYLDFFSQTAKDLWKTGLTDLYAQVPFDGLWLASNEATAECDGECPDGVVQQSAKQCLADDGPKNMTWYQSYDDQSTESTYKMPFIPGPDNLDKHTLSLNATHPSNNLKQYDTHSLMGHLQGEATRAALSTMEPIKDHRPFIMSRSTFAGSGQHVQHGLGENSRTWQDLRWAIAGMMNFNMFGIPMTGPDACGFKGADKTDFNQDELCGRWMQLTTFFPMARMHRDDTEGGQGKELFALDEPYRTWAHSSLSTRLSYVRLMYSCLYDSSLNGDSCFDPLFLHYPDLDQAFKDPEHSFMVANALKVTAVMLPQVSHVDSFFPPGSWVSMIDAKDIVTVTAAEGEWRSLEVKSDATSAPIVHLAPGKIIPFQPNYEGKFMTTQDTKTQGDVHFLLNRDANGYAEGSMFFDDGFFESELTDKTFLHFTYQHSGKAIKKWNKNTSPKEGQALPFYFHMIQITNAEDLKDTDFACARDIFTGSLFPLTVEYFDSNKTLQIKESADDTISMTELGAVYYGTKSKDLNQCDPASQFNKFDGGVAPNLDSYKASAKLISPSGGHQPLQLDLTLKQGGIVNLKWNFIDSLMSEKQFKIPKNVVSPLEDDTTGKLSDVVKITEDAGGSFKIQILNKKDGTAIYDLEGIILDPLFNFLKSTVHVDGQNFKGITGLSDQISGDLWLKDGTYTLWNKNSNSPESDGLLPGKNMYGSNPFYMAKADDGSWFGVYQNMVAASDWLVYNDIPNKKVWLETTATGGVGDLYIMPAPTPEGVTKAYQGLVGKPVLFPQWALGWHQCQFGTHDTSILRANVQKYSDFRFPLDAQWADIDLMDNFKDFTVDPKRFVDIKAFITEIKEKGIRFVPIVDAGIASRPDEEYLPYSAGLAYRAFITTENDEPLVGNVWPVEVVFPDFFATITQSYWTMLLQLFQKDVPFDGIWLEMNEIENFCDGACDPSQRSDNSIQNRLPYIPGGRSLEELTISLDGRHGDGFTVLDTHNLFATMQTQATHAYFTKDANPVRGLVVSRSGSQGIGQFGARQLGNNFSDKKYMGYSVTSIMAQNIAGVPMAGADICGFFGNTTADLCARWYVVGAFQPFSRNHNNLGSADQEPWSFSGVYIETIRNAMVTKLSLIRYYHSELLRLNAEGGTFYKPLFFEFPDDAGAYEAPMLNVMLGRSLKLGVPSTETTIGNTDFYYPKGLWCDVFGKAKCRTQATSGNVTITGTSLGDFYLELREGHLIPFQDAATLHTALKVNNTEDLKDQAVDFLVLPICDSTSCHASGQYLNDDDTQVDLDGNLNNYTISYERLASEPDTLTLTVTQNKLATKHKDNIINKADQLGIVSIYNAAFMGASQDYTVIATYTNQTTVAMADATYDATTERLVTQAAVDPNLIWLTDLSKLEFKKK